MERKLKIILCIILIALITIISFAGVYVKNESILPNYSLASDLKGKRVISFKMKDGTEERIYDSNGKKIAAIPDGANEADFKKETVKINPDENLNTENYKKVKEILKGRLASLFIEDYKVRVDENTGKVLIELEDNYDTDMIIEDLLCKGDFSITDSENGKILIDKSDLKNVKVLYSNGTEAGVVVYLDLEFNKEGSTKLANISKEYIKIEENSSNEENKEESSENKDDASEENKNENNDNSSEKKENQKKVTLTIEGREMINTYFTEEMTTGHLTISLGTAKDPESVQSYVKQGNFYAMLLNNDEMPITYELDTHTSVKGIIPEESLFIVVAICLVIFVVYMICRYKVDGIFSSLAMVCGISLLLLALRYTGTKISLNSIFGIAELMILNAYLISRMLNKIKTDPSYENVAKITIRSYMNDIVVIMASIVLAVVFTFMNKVMAFSLGMTLFYGIICIAITNITFLRIMLLAKYNKNK